MELAQNRLQTNFLVSNPADTNELFDETYLVRSAMVDLEYGLGMGSSSLQTTMYFLLLITMLYGNRNPESSTLRKTELRNHRWIGFT